MAVLTLGGAAAASPSEMKVEVIEIGSGEMRSASGALVKDVVAVKRRLSLRWAHLSPPQLSALLGQVKNVFTAGYPDPELGERTARFRCGDVSAGVLRMEGGAPVWTDVTMVWVEE